jgi:hypothetical protein
MNGVLLLIADELYQHWIGAVILRRPNKCKSRTLQFVSFSTLSEQEFPHWYRCIVVIQQALYQLVLWNSDELFLQSSG